MSAYAGFDETTQDTSSGSGSALDSILQSVNILGTNILKTVYAPANAGMATNPQGQVSGYGGIVPAASGGVGQWLVIGLLVLAGFWIFKKL